ncbi:hypothetical protein AVEN_71188-1 [Araneus ventricosus]|uniref:Uncharacterized protein n=1 Tax=Araneus ventricosus TaxID=182803 RepID=A0A4Y2KR33_ARAVE|nr:hypothetical protein AVEN_71188-1 [Araneus ventricosus]
MLPWIWSLFQVLVFGKFFYVIFMVPYALTFKNIEKNSKRKNKGTNVGIQDFTLAAKKDASTSTAEIDSANKETTNEKIELNIDSRQNGILYSNPFLEVMENIAASGDPFNPFNIETMCHPYQWRNPLMAINEADTQVNIGESYPPMKPTNPFFQDGMNNPFLDSSFQLPPVFEDEFRNFEFVPRESNAYCREWIEEHRKCYIKTVRSFSCY